MHVFLLCCHPEPKSFNHAMFHRAEQAFTAAGARVATSDLYALDFDPASSRRNFTTVKDPDYFKPQQEEQHATDHGGFAPDIERELRKVETCDLMVWQFPLWWFGLPAVLKGWVDRVYAMGRVYGGGRIYETGVFRGKRAFLSLTTGGPRETYVPGGFNGDILNILRPIHRGMLRFTGFDVLVPHIVYGPARMTDDERAAELERYAARLATVHDEEPIEVGAF